MSDAPEASSSGTRGRGRGKSRGGLGKYLRARGRGRGRGGRPAEFTTRLLLESEGKQQLTEEEEAEYAKELAQKFGRRQLGTNADRYTEEEPELDSDGEPILEPEVDLSVFLEKQKISEAAGPTERIAEQKDYDEDDVDASLAHITSGGKSTVQAPSKKGKITQIAWDEELDDMSREKKAAEATWDLKTRFRAKSEKLKTKPITPTPTSATRSRKPELQDAPALPLPEGTRAPPKSQIDEMEDFLDELLS